MSDHAPIGVAGKRLLIVEDEYIIAADLAYLLEQAGAEVVGPAGTVADALILLQAEAGRLDGAVLDVNLRDERVYPVADALSASHIPFLFATGYDPEDMPAHYADVPRWRKPIDAAALVRTIGQSLGHRDGAASSL